MELRTKLIAAVSFLILGISNISRAQKPDGTSPVPTSNLSTREAVNATNVETVNAENSAVKSLFSTLFPRATALQWSQNATSHFVSFLDNGRKATACFSAKGKLNYTIIECEEGHLPADLRHKMREGYEKYRLIRAIEINAYGQTAWQVIMENEKGYITLRYTADGLEELQQVKKQLN